MGSARRLAIAIGISLAVAAPPVSLSAQPAAAQPPSNRDTLGIDTYEWTADEWTAPVDGSLPGRSGLQLTARDMAKIGVLYLQHGRWRDRQLVSRDYVLESTRRHNDGGDPVRAGYGYLWWTMTTRNGSAAYFASGLYGQSIYNVPDHNLVTAVQSAESARRPWGGWGVINNVVMPNEAALLAQAPCIGRIE